MVARCACGLEVVIRTSWTNRNPGHRFYGCPTLSPTCVNFLKWYDPPMCQRYVQIIQGLLRSRNKLEEIVAMVEEKRRKLLKFIIISWVVLGFMFTVQCECLGKLLFLLHVLSSLRTQRKAQQANELSNLTRQRQLLASVNYRHAIIKELKRLPGNLVACKMREHLKHIQKAVFVKVIELKKELRLQVPP
ncbi:zinc finger, GRF-type containing protein [Tanacetum coccineum]